jgi:hypothetical protein
MTWTRISYFCRRHFPVITALGKEEATGTGAALGPVAGKRRGDGGRRCPGPVAREDEAAGRGAALRPVAGKRRGPGLGG